MRIAVTGATGFLGRYLVTRLTETGHSCRAWFRPTSDRTGFTSDPAALEWVPGGLDDPDSSRALVEGCDAVVHAALYHPGGGFRDVEGDLLTFVETNVLGSLRLIEDARAAGADRFVFISSCAVHETILPDRPLDETHPMWSNSHYGAHKAAIEAFVSSYGRGHGYPICALRPTGIYGLAHPPDQSKWFPLVRAIARGEDVTVGRAGKEVHAADVAQAVDRLLAAPAGAITGEAFNCYDRSISEQEVATIARDLTGSWSKIEGPAPTPKNQIVTTKLRRLGVEFGGRPLLERTIGEMLAATDLAAV